jgi:hypothetical protein
MGPWQGEWLQALYQSFFFGLNDFFMSWTVIWTPSLGKGAYGDRQE